jgi:hypothetical protein
MSTSKDLSTEQLLGLHWLIRLCWIAFCGFVVICLIAGMVLGVSLPVPVLTACIIATALGNVWLGWHRRQPRGGEKWLIPLILAADIIILTVMLYFAGGGRTIRSPCSICFT